MNRQRGTIPLTLILYGMAALAILGLLYGVYAWIDSSWETSAGIERGRKDTQKKWDDAVAAQRAKEQQAADSAVVKVEKQNAEAKVVYRTITRKVDKIVTRDVYRNICLEPVGLSAANDALRGASPATLRADGRVPEPDAP